jgi:transcriptional regulator with XRE-family HTH domain
MIKNKRRKKGLSQSDLARKLRISRTYVSKMERKVKGYHPSLDLIIKLSEELETCPLEIFIFFANINCKQIKERNCYDEKDCYIH